ncbi:MAG: hypothetical protein ING21_01990 [Burkholderiales bacterium]|jgi:uncharacterized membrane protein|nr:hypothetical protein [Burkholderiales bacterium]MCA3161943.1 hypothetical protein [Burkholderiales bacterium]MCA3163960.1 hypothetical protein [Burkholderiales bacterium]MCA3165255.1 hypothetical protein [Burkholderiales bacterium]MCA3170405.1 hypothetical protein [Burkholderiales bacterium]
MSQNPYAPPGADIEDVRTPSADEDGRFIESGHVVAAGRGLSWWGAAWNLFKAAPGMWILTLLAFFVLYALVAIIPVLNFFAGFVAMLMGTGLLIGCDDLHRGDPLRVGHLFAAFKTRPGRLIVLVVVTGLLSILAMLVAVLPFGLSMLPILFGMEDMNSSMMTGTLLVSILFIFLIFLALSIPIYMAYWFAPLLIVKQDFGVGKAMLCSLKACAMNFVPFLLYGLVGLVLTIVAMIPLFLGFLILIPMIIASIYTAYRDIFFIQR